MLRKSTLFILILLSIQASWSYSETILTHEKELGLYQTNKNTQFLKDNDILSPKSAHWLNNNDLVINALERGATIVYDTQDRKSWKKINVIEHKFKKPDFLTIPNYQDKIYQQDFMGKPVEVTSNTKNMWIPYYRFSWDVNSREGAAIAQINTKNYEIEYLLPAGNIPKMVTLSHNNEYLVSTHWGDNTIGIYNLKDNIPTHYESLSIEKKLNTQNIAGDRDKNCGFCLRGTLFTKDDKYLLIGRMGGGGIAIVDMINKKYIGTVRNVPATPRHLVLSKDGKTLYISTSYSGQVAKIDINYLLDNWKDIKLNDWKILNMGSGVRTIAIANDEKYLFATLNTTSQIAVIDVNDFKILEKYKVASFPVGMAVSPDDKYLAITSQGKAGQGGGNHVDIFVRNDKTN